MAISHRVAKLIAMACFCLNAFQAMAGLDIVEGSPSGFETLEAPRATFVVMYYGGRQLGNFPAHFTPDSLSFDDIDDVLRRVPDIKDREKIKLALTGKLPAHAELLCPQGQVNDCGKLKPEVAGIIFDQSRLAAELFINSAYLSNSDDTGPVYLPLPEREFTAVHNITGAVSGTGTNTPDYTLTNMAITSFGEGRLESQLTASNEGARVDTAAMVVDRNGYEEMAGLFRSRGMELISDRDIAGVSVSTSMNTMYDQRKVQGNSIVLYLPRRAVVSIYREGRLYSTRQYEAGNQYIDTSELPQGAYIITLHIQEADGTTRDETRFFAKWPDIPPPGIPTYYAQAGIIREPASNDSTLPAFTDQPIVRLGTVRRVTDNIGLDISMLGLNDRAAMETGMFLLEPTMQMRTTLLTSTRGDYGFEGSYQQILKSWDANVDVRRIFAADQPPLYTDPLIFSLTQLTASVDYNATPDLKIGLRASDAMQQGSMTQQSYGPTVQYYFWRKGESMLSLTADSGETDNHFSAEIFLHLLLRFGKDGVSSDGGFTRGNDNNGPTGNIRVFHDDTTADHSLIVGGTVEKDAGSENVSADADWRNQFGRIRSFVQEETGSDGQSFNYNSNFNFGLAGRTDDMHVGGDRVDQSAVIISVEGDSDAPMKILVNGTPHGIVVTGEKQAIYLPPYQVYDISLEPVKDALLDYDNNNRHVTLYPGNVARLAWQVNHFYVVLARIMTREGKPLENATLQESRESVATDEKGRLQAQVTRPKVLTFVMQAGGTCKVKLPGNVSPVNGVLIYHAPLLCDAA